jgi:predicted site-specific integrase-resolvase
MRMIKIGEASRTMGVSPQTMRQWEISGELVPDRKSSSGTRYYDLDKLLGLKIRDKESELTIGYARVSSRDQKHDLTRQSMLLESYCASKGWAFEIIRDMGSGMNYRKKGLKHLIDLILEKKIGRLVLTHKDRLLRFGAELVFSLCERRDVEVVIINRGEEVPFEEELAQDVLEIITVCSARLYGSRSHKNKKLLADIKNAVGPQDNP